MTDVKEAVIDIDEVVEMMTNIADAMIKEETKLKKIFNFVYPFLTYEDIVVDGVKPYSECCEVEGGDEISYDFLIHFYFDEIFPVTVTLGENLLTFIADGTITKDNLDISIMAVKKTDYPDNFTKWMLEIDQIGDTSLQSI